MDTQSEYRELLSKFEDITVLSTATGIIHWDMETKMPPGAVEQRSLQLSLLTRIQHQMSTNAEIGRLLTSIKSNPRCEKFGQAEKRNVYLIDKTFKEQTALPEKLVAEIAKQEAVTVNVWKKAKVKKNFGLFKPELQKMLNLDREAAEILAKVKQTKTPYEALIDNYEPKMTTNKITTTFNELQTGLKRLISKIQSSKCKPDIAILSKPVPVENQRQISALLTQTLGYDTVSPKARGRIDETEHPFTTGYYDDVRITTHYHVNNFASSIFSVLHESGHALYELALNPKWKYQPIGSPCSYGVHESQSRFYENVVGRSKEFWTALMPKLKKAAPSLAKLDLGQFVAAINRVERSKIRIEADEVTYNLHIVIRFEVERDLFAGKINVDELPEVWNQKYADYLNVEIRNDSEGVMQDTHWASGLFGYFPSYALGNLYTGQIRGSITKEIPDWRSQIEKGKLTSVNDWLNEKVHTPSNLFDPEELIKKATGKTLNSESYLSYLNEKYGEIYGF